MVAKENVDELWRTQREAWGNLWSQLNDARSIVADLGRDLTGFDEIRQSIGDVHSQAAGLTPLNKGMLRAASNAINALRAAVPEIVVPQAAQSDYRNPTQYKYIPVGSPEHPGFRKTGIFIWLGLVIVAVVVMRLFLSD